MNTKQLEIIKNIVIRAEEEGLVLWLDGGWAIDFLLGKISRDHSDIDIVFEITKKDIYKKILSDLGFSDKEDTDYGFLSFNDSILIDSESCEMKDGTYRLEGYPENSFPIEKTGTLNNFHLRCVSWDKMFIEYLWLEKQVPKSEWQPKHFMNLEVFNEIINLDRQKLLRDYFNRQV